MVDERHRSSMSGIKVREMSGWGVDKSRERYGKLDTPNMKAKDQSEPQRLGDDNNLRGPGWADDTAKDWRVGFGKNGVESAEGKPGFDRGRK